MELINLNTRTASQPETEHFYFPTRNPSCRLFSGSRSPQIR